MWSMWAWEIQRKSCCIAWWGQRPISKAILKEGKIMQVSWPAIDKPFTGYPCIFITHLVLFELSLSLPCSESLVPVSMASTNLLTVWVHKPSSWSGFKGFRFRIFCWVVQRCRMNFVFRVWKKRRCSTVPACRKNWLNGVILRNFC